MGYHGEPADHSAADNVVACASRCSFALGLKDLVEVAVIWGGLITCFFLVPLLFSLSDQRSKGALLLAFFGLPVKAVLLTRLTQKLLCVFEDPVVISVLRCIFSLGVNVCQADLDGAKLIFADPAIQKLFFAVLCRKPPLLPNPFDWNRKRPGFVPYFKNRLITADLCYPVLFLISL